MQRLTSLPDPHSLTRAELTSRLHELTSGKHGLSDERAVHSQIDALRSELIHRLRDEGKEVILGSDFLDPGSGGLPEAG
jgi:hypothetical protein